MDWLDFDVGDGCSPAGVGVNGTVPSAKMMNLVSLPGVVLPDQPTSGHFPQLRDDQLRHLGGQHQLPGPLGGEEDRLRVDAEQLGERVDLRDDPPADRRISPAGHRTIPSRLALAATLVSAWARMSSAVVPLLAASAATMLLFTVVSGA